MLQDSGIVSIEGKPREAAHWHAFGRPEESAVAGLPGAAAAHYSPHG